MRGWALLKKQRDLFHNTIMILAQAVELRDQYTGREAFVRPTYGMQFMDTDVCGLCTAQFGIRGPSYGIAGASAIDFSSLEEKLIAAAPELSDGGLSISAASALPEHATATRVAG